MKKQKQGDMDDDGEPELVERSGFEDPRTLLSIEKIYIGNEVAWVASAEIPSECRMNFMIAFYRGSEMEYRGIFSIKSKKQKRIFGAFSQDKSKYSYVVESCDCKRG